MARKVFISVLGTGNYTACFYVDKHNNFKSESTRFIQTATLENLNAKEWDKDDLALFLVTEDSHRLNWNSNGHTNRETRETIECEGLDTCLNKLNLDVKIESLFISDGKNTEEIWTIFESIYDKLEENDELYFDITHGFRYLPMLVLVLINYSKFLKGIKVKSISYGNFEARDRGTNEADIVDLTPLSDLQDWTTAASEFIEMGSVKKLCELTKKSVSPILKETKGKDIAAKGLDKLSKTLPEVITDITTCRGKDICSGTKVKECSNAIKELESTFIKPFNPVLEKVKLQLIKFGSEDNIKNGFAASVWCLENGLIQQCVTILQETTVTMICQFIDGLDKDNKYDRNLVNSVFSILLSNIPPAEWRVEGSNDAEKERRMNMLHQLKNNPLIISLKKSYSSLQIFRNDINHSGMNENASKSGSFANRIPDIQCTIIETFINL